MLANSVRTCFLTAVAACGLVACASSTQKEVRPLGLGRPVSESAVAAWNIDVTPNGEGLPAGGGSAREGDGIYQRRCAQCHDIPVFPQLIGGNGSLKTLPNKTVGSYWPYATTLYDYINRAMPPLRPQSMTPSQIYAIAAYILYANGIIARDRKLDRRTLPEIRMPNRDGFFIDDGVPDTSSRTKN